MAAVAKEMIPLIALHKRVMFLNYHSCVTKALELFGSCSKFILETTGCGWAFTLLPTKRAL
jgi:hypothetical protein